MGGMRERKNWIAVQSDGGTSYSRAGNKPDNNRIARIRQRRTWINHGSLTNAVGMLVVTARRVMIRRAIVLMRAFFVFMFVMRTLAPIAIRYGAIRHGAASITRTKQWANEQNRH